MLRFRLAAREERVKYIFGGNILTNKSNLSKLSLSD